MTIAQRTFFNPFRARTSAHAWGTRREHRQEAFAPTAAIPARTPQVQCLPWEGLYVENTEVENPAEAAPVSDLERFLASIMHGE